MATLVDTLRAVPQGQPESGGGLLDTLGAVGGASLGAVASAGNFLDLPGSSIRDVLAGQNPFDQWMTPLTDQNRTSGRQLLQKFGMQANKETGIGGWFSDPGEGLRDIAGFGAEVLLDPFGPLTKGTKMAAGAAKLVDRAHPLVKALAKGGMYAFDKLPEKAVGSIKDTLMAGGRGIKSLFNVASEGITDPYVMAVKENAHAAAKVFREQANLISIETVQTANKSGFSLDIDDKLDMSDPQNWNVEGSPLVARGREDQIWRYLEGTYDPTNAKFGQGDLVTIGDDATPREVEYMNRTATGTKVKLAGDDNLYDDLQLKPHWLSEGQQIPDELIPVLDRLKNFRDGGKARAEPLGLNIGELFDRHVAFAHRRKGSNLRRAESISGLGAPDYTRKNYQNLASTLMVTGSREMMYKSFVDGTPGVNKLFADKLWESEFKRVNDLATTPATVNGVQHQILPDMVGLKHVDDVASALGMTSEELWKDVMTGRPVNATNTRAYTTAPGTYAVVRNAAQVGQIVADIADDGVATLRHAMPIDGSLKDALHDVEWHMANQKLAKKIVIDVDPSDGSKLKDFGYTSDKPNADGTERWVKNIYDADALAIDKPRFMPKGEFVGRIKNIMDFYANEVKQGNVPGVQPGRGWWKSFTDIRLNADGTERVINTDPVKSGFVEVNAANVMDPAIRANFTSRIDYDDAINAVQSGETIWVGIQKKKGKAAELLMLKPTMRHQIEAQRNGLLKGLDKLLTDNPLTQSEAIIDTVHAGVTRNYGDKVDQWMPEIDPDTGKIIAADTTGPIHAAGLKEFHGAFSELIARGEDGNLTKPMSTLLRMDDDSLKALMFTDSQMKELGDLRTARQLNQDVSIGLVDRHRALAEELSTHIEKRYNKMYEGSALVSNLDYLNRNAGAISLLESTKTFIAKGVVDARSNPERFGTSKLGGNLEVNYDLNNKRGMSFNEAMDEGFFGQTINSTKFLESVRQELIGVGAFKNVDDAKEITAQLNEIKSLRLLSNSWTQLKTMNEMASMTDLPELETPLRWAQNLMTVEKAGLLGVTPTTGMRDGLSSYVNAVVMGDQNPAALLIHGKKAMSFTRGMPVDPGEGIADIEAYLSSRGIKSDTNTRAEAFQNMWNAHYMSGSTHPNVVTADAIRMAESDSSMAILNNAVGGQPKEFLEGLKRTVQKPWRALDYRVEGMWMNDELGRPVKRSDGKNTLVQSMNGFRGMIDTSVRATYVLDRVSKEGVTVAQALADADRVLMNADPKNFTRFETKFMKSAFPFYSFMRQSLPLFLSEMMVNPGGKLGMTIRASRLAQGGGDEYVPYQYLDSAAIPIGQSDDGTLKYLTSLGLMHEDAVKYAGNALQMDHRGLLQHALSSANPAAKWVIEHSTNTSLFSQGPMGGRRLDDLDPTMGRIATNLGLQSEDASGRATPVGSPVLESLASAGPLSRMLSTAKMLTTSSDRLSAKDKVIRMLSGARIENVSQEQVTRDLRDRLNALQIQLGARPLTIVSGADKLKKYAEEQGDTATAERLDRIEKALSAQRKIVADQEKKSKEPTKALIDRLRELR